MRGYFNPKCGSNIPKRAVAWTTTVASIGCYLNTVIEVFCCYPTIADESTKTFTQYDNTAVVPFARTVSDSPPASHGCRRASSAVMRLHGSASRRRPNRSLAFVDTDSHTSWVEFREMHARNGNSWSDLVL